MIELTEATSRRTDTFRVGVIENIVNSRYGPDPLLRAAHLAAVAAGVDSFWVPDRAVRQDHPRTQEVVAT